MLGSYLLRICPRQLVSPSISSGRNCNSLFSLEPKEIAQSPYLSSHKTPPSAVFLPLSRTMAETVIEIEDLKEWEKTLGDAKSSGKVIIVDYSATWCQPCKVIGPVFHELSKKYPQIIFVKVDVDDVKEVSDLYEIRAMPTFQVFKDGVKVDELVGASKERLEQLVAKHA
eukprot:TRINITY_DN3699_c0_g2_i1.p1 TRINITY_DN3699_c0_g2~~TRINITY_DN3699_c0_g2_i1.p1  ORF type:complete len:170 (-),score=29.89 TRINITY_DN3699_c0_g2_i1:516-1025(-)